MRNLGLSAVWRWDMRHEFSLAFVAAFAVFPLGSAIAQVGESGYSLPLALAVKAATKAIATCASAPEWRGHLHSTAPKFLCREG
jgi:hypothetical protein